MHPTLQSKLLLPPGRVFCVNTLWLVLNQLRVFVAQEELGRHIYSRYHSSIPYSAMVQQLVDIFNQTEGGQRESVSLMFDGCLCIGSLVSDMQYQVEMPQLMQEPDVCAYIANLKDCVLDFVDLMFPWLSPQSPISSGQQQKKPSITATTTTVLRQSFGLACFGIKNEERAKAPTWATPQLARPDSLLLSVLWEQSAERRRRRMLPGGLGEISYIERRDRMEQLECLLVKHPYIFIALFQVLFQPHPLPPTQRLSFKECHRYLQALGLYVNTDPSKQSHQI